MTLFWQPKLMRFNVLVFICLLFVVGCSSGSNDTLSQLQPGQTILAFGDSLTEGKGVSKSHSYPSHLQHLTGFTVINDGISGSVSSEGVARLEASLEKYQPSLVIICYGGNDILRNRSKAELKANLKTMVDTSQSYGAEVVLVAVPGKSLLLKSLPLYKELADEMNLPLQNTILAKLLSDNANKSDTVHLNEQGYELFAKALFELLQDSGAL